MQQQLSTEGRVGAVRGSHTQLSGRPQIMRLCCKNRTVGVKLLLEWSLNLVQGCTGKCKELLHIISVALVSRPDEEGGGGQMALGVLVRLPREPLTASVKKSRRPGSTPMMTWYSYTPKRLASAWRLKGRVGMKCLAV